MKQMLTVLIGALVVSAAATSLLPASATEGTGPWLDARGCKVWNPIPTPGETVTWSGRCTGGFADGTGELRWFIDGRPVQVYSGPVRSGKPAGKGLLTWPNGARYDGDFVEGKRTGRGVYISPSGHRYEGDFVDGEPSGNGDLTFASGERYTGGFVNGQFHGKGVHSQPKGERYEGEFADGKPTNGRVLFRGEPVGVMENGTFRRITVAGAGSARPDPSAPLGSRENPVRAFRPAGQREYLGRLRCPGGNPPEFERAGSIGPGPYGNILDSYTVKCDPSKSSTVVIDMYHEGYSETAAVPGFTIVRDAR